MSKISKLAACAAFILTVLLMLTACEKKEEEPWIPESTAIQVSEDGVITETIIDRLRESYYDSEELKTMVYATVRDYTQEHGADSITVTEYTAEGSAIRIVLTYAGWEDYAAYNNVRFFNGSMLKAQMAGFLFETSFQIVAKDGSVSQQRISSDGPVSHKEYQVLVTDRSHAVEVPGNIVYVSAPASVENRRIAFPLETEEVLDEADVSSEEAGLFYVLYEAM